MKLFSANPFWPNGGITFIRVVVGLLVFYHGIEIFDKELMVKYAGWKQFENLSNPLLMVYIGKAAELVSGLLLTIGLLTRVTTAMLIITMLYLTFFVGQGRFWYQEQHPFLFALLGLMFLFIGPGKYSMDNLICKPGS